MSASEISPPFEVFTDVDGDPLKNGYIYIGAEGLNPETNPVDVYWDSELTIPAAQPIRTISGYASRDGSPGRLFVSSASYSILIRNKNGSLVYSQLNATGVPPKEVSTIADLIAGQYNDGDMVRTKGYSNVGDGGGATYIIFSSATLLDGDHQLDNGKIAKLQIPAFNDARWWGARGNLYDEAGVVNPLPVNDRDALIDARSRIRESKTGQMLDGGNFGYYMEQGVSWNKGDSGLKNFFFQAAPAFADATTNDSVVGVKVGLNINVENITIDLQGNANGIYNETNGFNNHYCGLKIDKFKDFGLRADGSGDQHLTGSLITQDGEVANRTVGSVCAEINANDFKMSDSTLRYAETPLKINANTGLYTGVHIYNGSANSVTPATNSRNIDIAGGSGNTFCHSYIDKGRVDVRTFANGFFDTKLLYDSVPEHNSVFRFDAGDTTDQNWPSRFVFDGCFGTLPLANGSMDFLNLFSSGTGTWSTSAQNIKDEINRYPGYPRVVSEETSQVIASQRSIVVDGSSQLDKHSFSDATDGNNNQAIDVTYSIGSYEVASGGIDATFKAKGMLASGSLNLEGSRTSAGGISSTFALKNRRNNVDFTLSPSTIWAFETRVVDANDDAMYIKASATGQNGYTDYYRFSDFNFRPEADGTLNLGAGAFRWNTVYATNGTINTSDRNQKDLFTEMPQAWVDVLCSIADKIQLWKWKDAIEAKGDAARWHVGPIAQEVHEAFAAIGVDAFEYGFVGKDKKVEKVFSHYADDVDDEGNVMLDKEGNAIQSPVYIEVETGDELWNLRHSELQYAIQWAQQRKIDFLLARC